MKKKTFETKKEVLTKFQCELDIMFQSTFDARLVCTKCLTVTSVNYFSTAICFHIRSDIILLISTKRTRSLLLRTPIK